MEEGSGGVATGAVGTGGLEDEGEEAVAAQAMARAHPGNPGLATEDMDLFDPQPPTPLHHIQLLPHAR